MTRDWKLTQVPYYRLEEASDVLARAFAEDAIIGYFIPLDRPDRYNVLKALFRSVCFDRLALNQPLLAAEWDNKLAAVACVIGTYSPPETESMKRDGEKLQALLGPETLGRMKEYREFKNKNLPPRKHHYLQTIGVDPDFQSMGFGRALLESVVDVARDDPTSAGVMLDTDGDKNLVFYERCGFTVSGREKLGGVNLVFMYRGVR